MYVGLHLMCVSRLGYGNSLWAGLLASATKLLQSLQQWCAPRFQSTQILPRDPPPTWPSLASCCGPHLIQDDGVGLPGCQQNWTHLLPNTGQTRHPSVSTLLYYSGWPAGTPITECKESHTSLFWHLSGVTNGSMSGQWNHLPYSAKDSRLICSHFTSASHSMTPSQLFFYFLLYRWWYVVRNELIVCRFGQKCLLNALNEIVMSHQSQFPIKSLNDAKTI